MPSPSPERLALAERLYEYFELQLTFADHLAQVRDMPLGEAISLFTNLRRRFAMGEAAGDASWRAFLDEAIGLETPQARARLAVATFAAAPDEPAPSGQTAFGCFACEDVSADGAIKLHFNNRDPAGPLSHARMPARRAELTRMFGFIRETFATARTVKGASWLYNTEAYRRLYPAAYSASRRTPTAPIRLSGTSSWGQFLKRDGSIKAGLRAQFLERWPNLDPQAPWRVFPLPALVTEAPIEAFYEDLGL